MNTKTILFRLLLAGMLLLLAIESPHAHPAQIGSTTNRNFGQTRQAMTLETLGQLPLSFEANQGQVDAYYTFMARGPGNLLLLAPNEAVVIAKKTTGSSSLGVFKGLISKDRGKNIPDAEPVTTMRMQLVGANPDSKGVGLEELPGRINYYLGNDPALWRRNVPTYARVSYPDVYPGVDLTYYGNQNQLEYDFVIAPGVDPKVIQLAFQDIDKLKVNAQGDLVINAREGGEQLRMVKPLVYQEIAGMHQEVPCSYALSGANEVSFLVGAYDASRPLVIDPLLTYSTCVNTGCSGWGIGIAIDKYGNAYITGLTEPHLPVVNPWQTTYGGGGTDAFVMKLNYGGTIEYATYLGGNGYENVATLIAGGITVDSAGNAYVTGSTNSTDFPTLNPFQLNKKTHQPGVPDESFDAFVAKLDTTGMLNYSTYLGGSGEDDGIRIAVDSSRNIYVTGHTNSTDYYTTTGTLQQSFAGDGSLGCSINNFYFCGDAFVTKLNPAGSALIYSTYLGGSEDDIGIGIAVDAEGNAYVAGETFSENFPKTTPPDNPFQSEFGGYGSYNFWDTDIGPFGDAFLLKLNPDGTELAYSTYLGGSGGDIGITIAVDASGYAYLTGLTGSDLIMNTNPVYPYHGISDAFVAKVNPDGSDLVYFTYLGGSNFDAGIGLAVDSRGNAYVTGGTGSADFPLMNPLEGGACGFFDVFITKLDIAGSALVYSTCSGGSDYGGTGVAVDAAGNAYVTGGYNDHNCGTFIAKLVLSTETEVGTDVEVQPVDASTGTTPVTLSFSTVTVTGTTSLSTSSSGPTPPAGFSLGETPTYYEINTTAMYESSVTICIAYDIAQFGDPNSLYLLHYEGNEWVDVTTSNDTLNYVICGEVTSLSPFAVAELSPNDAPTLGEITAPIDPIQVNTTVTTNASFTDPNDTDTHIASWDWGDGSTSLGIVDEDDGSGTVTGTHSYANAGVYTVKVTVTDPPGESDVSTYQYIVVYDPSAGFVTGGGWINSPVGAYTADPTLTGKANFGFVAKYQHGAKIPSGQTQFKFHAAGLDFHSTDYQWLVIAGAKAMYKGSGTINGSGDYGFMLTALDGQVNGGGGLDKFRIKIWDKITSDLIYDNQMDAPEDADPTTVIVGGSIVIHR